GAAPRGRRPGERARSGGGSPPSPRGAALRRSRPAAPPAPAASPRKTSCSRAMGPRSKHSQPRGPATSGAPRPADALAPDNRRQNGYRSPVIRVFALCTGRVELDRASMLDDLPPGQPWTVPVPSFLVAHSPGRLLFDTGIHEPARLDPIGRLGPERAKRLGVRSREGEDAVAQLALLSLGPDDVHYVANSHLHFDHCGGNEFFPRSTFLVQRAELDVARPPGFAPGYNPSRIDFDHPLDYRMVDGEHDVFGDGRVILFPTFGHTPGHQSLRVRPDSGPDLVCAADACYTRENMDRDVLPRILWNGP